MSKNATIYCNLLTASTKDFYGSIGSIYCPVLSVNEKIYKLNLFPLAIPVIKNATIIMQERDIQMRSNRKKGAPLKSGKTYALVAVVGKKNPIAVRVILLRIGNGQLMFRSIMKHQKTP